MSLSTKASIDSRGGDRLKSKGKEKHHCRAAGCCNFGVPPVKANLLLLGGIFALLASAFIVSLLLKIWLLQVAYRN